MMIPNLQGQAVAVYGWHAAVGPCRARNPRWEPGTGMIPDPLQIGDGGGDGPPIPGQSGMGPPSPIPGKSGMAVGMGIGGSVPWSDARGTPTENTPCDERRVPGTLKARLSRLTTLVG